MKIPNRSIIMAVASAGLLLLAVYAFQTPQASHVASAERSGAVAIPAAAPRVMALGRLEPVSEVIRAAAPMTQDAGRLAEILVAEGDWVEQGQALAYFDTRPRLVVAQLQAEANLEIRKAALAKMIADLNSQEQTLNAALEQQEAQRDRARWDFERLEQLQKSGLYKDTVLIDKRLALDSANQALKSARLLLDRNRRRDASGVRIDEAGARADVVSAESAVAKAKADLAFSVIRAPISGRILRRMGRLGEQIGQDGFAEIGDTRSMMVRAEVFESDLRRVIAGAHVVVSSRAITEGLSGAVERIGLKVNRQSMVGEDPATSLDARVIEVLIALDAQSSVRAANLTGLQVRVLFLPEAGS